MNILANRVINIHKQIYSNNGWLRQKYRKTRLLHNNIILAGRQPISASYKALVTISAIMRLVRNVKSMADTSEDSNG